jgi:hypothetical protein
MYCLRCGQHLPEDAAFCSRCGTEQDDDSFVIQCQTCGTLVNSSTASWDPDQEFECDDCIARPLLTPANTHHKCDGCGNPLVRPSEQLQGFCSTCGDDDHYWGRVAREAQEAEEQRLAAIRARVAEERRKAKPSRLSEAVGWLLAVGMFALILVWFSGAMFPDRSRHVAPTWTPAEQAKLVEDFKAGRYVGSNRDRNKLMDIVCREWSNQDTCYAHYDRIEERFIDIEPPDDIPRCFWWGCND